MTSKRANVSQIVAGQSKKIKLDDNNNNKARSNAQFQSDEDVDWSKYDDKFGPEEREKMERCTEAFSDIREIYSNEKKNVKVESQVASNLLMLPEESTMKQSQLNVIVSTVIAVMEGFEQSQAFCTYREMTNQQIGRIQIEYFNKKYGGAPGFGVPSAVAERLKMLSELVTHLSCFAEYYGEFCELILTRQSIRYREEKMSLAKFIVLLFNRNVMNTRWNCREGIELSRALSDLMVKITSHYGKYESIATVDHNLKHLLKMTIIYSPYEPDIIYKLLITYVNISSHPNRLALLREITASSLPPDHPSNDYLSPTLTRAEVDLLNYYEKINVVRVSVNSCHFWILFNLLIHTFPRLDKVSEHLIPDLQRITAKLNQLVYLFIINADETCEIKCPCHHFILQCFAVVNDQALKYRDAMNSSYADMALSNIKSFLAMSNELLDSRKFSNVCARIPCLHDALVSIHFTIVNGDIKIANESQKLTTAIGVSINFLWILEAKLSAHAGKTPEPIREEDNPENAHLKRLLQQKILKQMNKGPLEGMLLPEFMDTSED